MSNKYIILIIVVVLAVIAAVFVFSGFQSGNSSSVNKTYFVVDGAVNVTRVGDFASMNVPIHFTTDQKVVMKYEPYVNGAVGPAAVATVPDGVGVNQTFLLVCDTDSTVTGMDILAETTDNNPVVLQKVHFDF